MNYSNPSDNRPENASLLALAEDHLATLQKNFDGKNTDNLSGRQFVALVEYYAEKAKSIMHLTRARKKFELAKLEVDFLTHHLDNDTEIHHTSPDELARAKERLEDARNDLHWREFEVDMAKEQYLADLSTLK